MDDSDDRRAQLRQSLLDSNEEEKEEKTKFYSKRIKRPNSAWFIFDNLSTQQGEDLLRQHGNNASYLVSHFHDPRSYLLIIRFDEEDGLVFKNYAIGISGKQVYVEGISGYFKSLEDCILAVEEELGRKLVPIFHQYDCQTCEYTLSTSEEMEVPPDYTPAQKYPEAPKRPLPVIVPIRPTLRRLQQATMRETQQPGLETEITERTLEHGCCWRAFHTDVDGHWYKPHKAGPCMAVLLVIGWFFFLLLFGWIIALALLLVGILVACAYTLNFVCTGRCSIDDDDDD